VTESIIHSVNTIRKPGTNPLTAEGSHDSDFVIPERWNTACGLRRSRRLRGTLTKEDRYRPVRGYVPPSRSPSLCSRRPSRAPPIIAGTHSGRSQLRRCLRAGEALDVDEKVDPVGGAGYRLQCCVEIPMKRQ
jgi:hypothetical protein